MGYPTTFHACFALVFVFIQYASHFSTTEANKGGFSVRLIRKTATPNMNAAESPVSANLGHYLMELSIGTPPVTIQGIADTGSDLIWTSCVPCVGCYTQQKPMFDPQKSSTYTNISCTSEQCHELDTGVCSPQSNCNYTYAYASAAITQGVLAQETVTFASTTGQHVSLEAVIFGCGHNDTGGFNDREMGIIGLGGGAVSLISQMGPTFGGRKFSHCFVPFHTDISISSTMSFGSGSEVSGDGVVSTPLVAKEDKTPYFVTLQGISVGNKYLPFDGSSQAPEKGNMFIDSGTPPTILPQQLYDGLVAEVRNQVAMKPIEGDPDLGTQLCYETATNLVGPMLTAHFESADVQLSPIQTFVSPKDGVYCLGFVNTSSPGGVYGNFAQSDCLIGFDLDRQVVSFKPTDCTKQ